MAVNLLVAEDGVVNPVQSGLLRPEHRAAAVIGEAVAMDIDDVDVAGPLRDAFIEDPRALVDHPAENPPQDLLVGDRLPCDAQLGRNRRDEGFGLRIGNRVPALVAVITASALLA